MRIQTMFAKSAAFVMAAVVAIASSGCGTKDHTADEKNNTQTGTGQENIFESGQEDSVSGGTGRYVEKTVFEGEYYNLVNTQILNNGQLVFINSATGQKFVSKDDGETWEIEKGEAFAAFTQEHYPAATAMAKDGMIAMIVMDENDSGDYDYNLYIYNTDDTSKQVPAELPDADSYIDNAVFDEQGNLYVAEMNNGYIYQVDLDEGSYEKVVKISGSCQQMDCKNNILMCVSKEKIFLYDLEKKSFIEDEALEDFIKENCKSLAWTGGGYNTYAFLGNDDAVYIACEKGLYRHSIGGSAIEQVIDGGLSSLGAPSQAVMAMMMNDSNEFFIAYSSGKIVKFAYDAKVPSVPDNKLTVYSLTPDDTVKQTIAVFQVQNPDMYVDYQIGMDEGGVTREDALKKLNTQLLSGSGPDVIMLDGMDMDTYVEKGALMDLSDIVDGADKSDGLYMNLIQNMQGSDKVYAVPASFCIPAILGHKEMVDSIKDYKALADFAVKAREESPDGALICICSAAGIMKRAMPVCAPSWKNEKGSLDTQKIREFLEQSKQIYDAQMNGTPQEYIALYRQRSIEGVDYEDTKYFMSLNDTSYMMKETVFEYGELTGGFAYRDVLSVPKLAGLGDTVCRPLNGQSSNVYHPVTIAGINAAAKNADAAKQFVGIMLGEEVQDQIRFNAIPVNKNSLAEQFAYEEEDLGEDGGINYISMSDQNGNCFDYVIYPIGQEEIGELEKWIEGLDTPYLGDPVLQEAVYKEGAAYIEGMTDLDSAVKAIEDSVEIYLYE